MVDAAWVARSDRFQTCMHGAVDHIQNNRIAFHHDSYVLFTLCIVYIIKLRGSLFIYLKVGRVIKRAKLIIIFAEKNNNNLQS